MCLSSPEYEQPEQVAPPKTLDQAAPEKAKSSTESDSQKAAQGTKKYRSESSLSIPTRKTKAAVGYRVT